MRVGRGVGTAVGTTVGSNDGMMVGKEVGIRVGDLVGINDGSIQDMLIKLLFSELPVAVHPKSLVTKSTNDNSSVGNEPHKLL